MKLTRKNVLESSWVHTTVPHRTTPSTCPQRIHSPLWNNHRGQSASFITPALWIIKIFRQWWISMSSIPNMDKHIEPTFGIMCPWSFLAFISLQLLKSRPHSPLPSLRELTQVRSQELLSGWGCASLPYFSLHTAEFGQQKEMSKEYEIQIGTYTEAGLSGSEEIPSKEVSSVRESSITQGPIRLQAVFNWTSVRISPGLWLLIMEKPASVKPPENRQLSNLPKCVCVTNYTQSLWDLHISLLFACFNPTLYRPTVTSKLKLYQKSRRRFEEKNGWFVVRGSRLCLQGW